MTETQNQTRPTKPPSVLAFEAKLLCSDATMMAGCWEDDILNSTNWKPNQGDWIPIKITEKSVRGTISNRDKRSDENNPDHAKFLKDISNPNPQTVDNAALPSGKDTLKVSFTLKVLGHLAEPTACNDPSYKPFLQDIINGYISKHTMSTLAFRYAKNIANGRFLWRNRVDAEKVVIHVTLLGEKSPLVFDAYKIGKANFDEPESPGKENLNKLASVIQKGLESKSGEHFTLITIDAYSKLGDQQQVFPSQEMNLDKGNKSETIQKGKLLYKLNEGDSEKEIAAIHSQKLGNAIRTIDTWHSRASDIGPIAVEPFGSVTTHGDAYRPHAKNSFYKLLDDWIEKGTEPPQEQQHYVMAVFVRGGVFSE